MGVAVVRGTGSIGRRWARVLGEHAVDLGLDAVGVWPVSRPVQVPGPVVRPLAAWPERPDLVVVATDTSRHVADALDALAAGARHVLVEKPVAPEAAAAGPLVTAAGRVSVAAPLRFTRGARLVAEAVRRWSPVVHARVDCGSWLPSWRPERDHARSYSARPDEGGVLRDLVHDVDVACTLLGVPELVTAVLGRGRLGIAAEETVDALWRCPGGATAALRLDYVSRVPRRRVEVVCAGGSVTWDLLAAEVVTRSADEDEDRRTPVPADLDRDGLLLAQARDALTGGAASPLADAVAAVSVLDALRHSASTGCWTAPGEPVATGAGRG